MMAVSEAASDIIIEIRRQFHADNGALLKGEATADHARCVAIATDAALRYMVLPGAIAILIPILLGVYMANAGGAWDNAKKLAEKEGLKGTEHHAATVTGDTVGDPFKDTSGPSLNILIKLMSVVSLLFADFFLEDYDWAGYIFVGVLFLITIVALVIAEKKVNNARNAKEEEFNNARNAKG